MLTKEKSLDLIREDLTCGEENPVVDILFKMDPMSIISKWMAFLGEGKSDYSQYEANALLYVAQSRPPGFFKEAQEYDAKAVLRAVTQFDKQYTKVIEGGCDNPEPSSGLWLVDG